MVAASPVVERRGSPRRLQEVRDESSCAHAGGVRWSRELQAQVAQVRAACVITQDGQVWVQVMQKKCVADKIFC